MFKSGYETNTCINHNRLRPGMNQGIDTSIKCPDQWAIIQKKIHEVLPKWIVISLIQRCYRYQVALLFSKAHEMLMFS